jgi:primosomal protein N' (replication factor Y)
VLKSLKEAGYVMVTDEVEQRDPFAKMQILPSPPLPLTEHQAEAMDEIREAFAEEVPRPVLLHGVTGSGKTEVYLQSITICLELGRASIVLVPEIALTPQTVERFRGRFGNEVSVLHSRLSDGERFDEWTRISKGEVKIAVGARSALFAPFRDVGLIVVDEEHEPSYKQDRPPRYSARDVAVMRGRIEKAVVILGSATPAVESYYNAQQGRYRLASLPMRVDDAELPKMECVDLGAEPEGQGFLSKRLISSMYEALDQGEQVMLFLNRRGFATKMTCPQCGFVAGCDDCSVTYTYHRKAEHLVCHLCGMVKKAPAVCPECGSAEVRFGGIGTQRIQAAVNAVFGDARTLRMDADTMTRKNSYQEALTAFRAGAVDVLIGTQMIAKGLHFPNVTLVGVVFADLSLNIPDFRAAERTFQLLVQVAGRAGRGELPGKVVIQTFTPHNPIIRAAMQQDYEAFYQLEIAGRQGLSFPPYRRLITILIRGPEEGEVGISAERIAKAAKSQLPSPSPLERRRGEYYWFILYVTDNVMQTGHVLRHVLRHLRLPRNVRTSIDVDPMTVG